MDRRQLEYFLAVVDYGGFTSASHVLRVAQPSLSQSVKTLERELGLRLFHRLGHGVKLTDAGQALVGPARQVMRDFGVAADAVSNVAGLRLGKLDIAGFSVIAADPLAGLVSTCLREHPGIAIRIIDRGADPADLVRSGECELAFTIAPVRPGELEALYFDEEEMLLVMPPDASHEPGAVLPVTVLEDLPLLVGASTKAALIRMLDAFGVMPRIAVESDHREALLPIIRAGSGAALLPPKLAGGAAKLGAVVCHLDPPVARTVVVLHRRGPVSPAAEAFLEVVSATLPAPSVTQ